MQKKKPATPEAQTWQPIETMPTDGSPVLVNWPETIAVRGRTVDIVGIAEYREILSYGERPATHWMPLPAPPDRSTGEK